jgi:hypothetical protein
LYIAFDPEATKNQRMINATLVGQVPGGHKVKIAETGGIHWNEHQSASGGGHKGFCQS